MPVALVLALWAFSGCSDTMEIPAGTGFGRVGEIRVEVRSLLGDRGYMDEILIWLSDGPWLLTERVSYDGNGGSETQRSSRLNPGELAREYASLIDQLNRTQGLSLFGESVPQTPNPECATAADLADPGRLGDPLPDTRVVVTIRDDARDLTASWVRCAEGTLLGSGNTIVPADAAPLGSGAERVITAAQLTRFFTLDDDTPSTYKGTIPFAALAQGQDSPARPEGSKAFDSANGSAPADFRAFWADHAGASAALPRVDWANEVVLLAAVGERGEAGDVVRVRRVEGLGPGTPSRVRLVERIPGDFCSPLTLDSYPFQIVVVPRERLSLPLEFTDATVERIPCGG